jgi:hypothetical protein
MRSVSLCRFVLIVSADGGTICLKLGDTYFRTVESATIAIGLPLRLDKRLF